MIGAHCDGRPSHSLYAGDSSAEVLVANRQTTALNDLSQWTLSSPGNL